MLSGMDYQLLTAFPEGSHEWGQFDELWPCSDNVYQFQLFFSQGF